LNTPFFFACKKKVWEKSTFHEIVDPRVHNPCKKKDVKNPDVTMQTFHHGISLLLVCMGETFGGAPIFEFSQEPSAPVANDMSCCIHAGFYVTLLGQSQ
jgi:hypothetical protein